MPSKDAATAEQNPGGVTGGQLNQIDINTINDRTQTQIAELLDRSGVQDACSCGAPKKELKWVLEHSARLPDRRSLLLESAVLSCAKAKCLREHTRKAKLHSEAFLEFVDRAGPQTALQNPGPDVQFASFEDLVFCRLEVVCDRQGTEIAKESVIYHPHRLQANRKWRSEEIAIHFTPAFQMLFQKMWDRLKVFPCIACGLPSADTSLRFFDWQPIQDDNDACSKGYRSSARTFAIPICMDIGGASAKRGAKFLSKRIHATGYCFNCAASGDKVKLRKCSRCQAALYCPAECQKVDWEKHREECHPVGSTATSSKDF